MESRFVYLAFKENLPKFNNICEWFPRSLGWGFLHDPYCIFRIWYGKCLFWHKCMSDFLLILSSLYFLILLLFSISWIIDILLQFIISTPFGNIYIIASELSFFHPISLAVSMSFVWKDALYDLRLWYT